ncbi:hypothetical protein [Tychonema bourrellyi]|uniref:hypothetical protein n=1 Tax=Tychonema bourrellyi TaxID=54313 RepID=UPI0015D509F2|nr:hypothetical protein [Tychonema bourrellyi]
MPTPQENSFFVEQASCLLLTMVQHMSLIDIARIASLEQAGCLFHKNYWKGLIN